MPRGEVTSDARPIRATSTLTRSGSAAKGLAGIILHSHRTGTAETKGTAQGRFPQEFVECFSHEESLENASLSCPCVPRLLPRLEESDSLPDALAIRLSRLALVLIETLGELFATERRPDALVLTPDLVRLAQNARLDFGARLERAAL